MVGSRSDAVGNWTPEFGPLRRTVSTSGTATVVLGLGMVGFAAALGWLGWYGRAQATLATWLVLGGLIIMIGGLGVLSLVSIAVKGPSRIEIGEVGITSNRLAPTLWTWSDVGRVTIRVTVRRESQIGTMLTGSLPMPRWLRSHVRIRLELQPSPETSRRPARIHVVEPFVSDGEDVAIVRDLDAALRCYAKARYAGVHEDIRTRP